MPFAKRYVISIKECDHLKKRCSCMNRPGFQRGIVRFCREGAYNQGAYNWGAYNWGLISGNQGAYNWGANK